MTFLFLLIVAVLILVGLKGNDVEDFNHEDYEEYDFYQENKLEEESEK
jgi:hypothetical protein